MKEEILYVFPESGQKIVSKVSHENYGNCIKKEQKDIESINRIKKEIEIQKKLNCIYFPKIFYYEIDEEHFLIYEELIDGNLLRDSFNEKEYYLNEDKCLKLLEEIVIGISYIWDYDIVHRDIKPENIIIRDNKPVILDLGIAKNLNSSSVTVGGMAHTPGYAPPEQFLNNRDLFGKRSDMFSIGIVIYEAYYGKRPFRNNHEIAMSDLIFDENTEISNKLKEILQTLLEKLPHKRCRNSKAILAKINEKLGEE